MAADAKYTYWIQSGWFMGLAKLTSIAFGFITTFIFSRSLLQSELGNWAIFLIITSIIEVLRNGFLRNTVLRYINISPQQDHRQIFQSAFFINMVITLSIGLLLGLAFVFGLENGLNAPGLASMFFSFTPGLFCLIFFSHYEWALSAGKNFRGIFLMYLVRTGLNLLLIVILLLLKTKPEPVLIVWFFNAGIFAGAVTGFFFSGQHYNPVSFGFKTWIEKMFHFGKFVFTSNLLSTVFRNADHFITAALLTSGAVAPLSISTRITNIIDVPSQILADILFPQTAMSNEDNNPGRIRYLFEKAVGGVLAIVLPLFLFIFLLPEQVMTIVAGKQYGSYWFFLRIMILTSLFMPFLKQFGTIMDSTGVPQNSIKIMIIVTAIQVISCFVCIKQFGLMGVAYAAVFTQLCGFIIGQFMAARKYNIRYANAFKYALAFYGDLFRLIKNKTAPLWKKS